MPWIRQEAFQLAAGGLLGQRNELSSSDSYRVLYNFKPVRGKLEQTPYWWLVMTGIKGVVPIELNGDVGYLFIGESGAFNNLQQSVPVVAMTEAPPEDGTDPKKYALLYGGILEAFTNGLEWVEVYEEADSLYAKSNLDAPTLLTLTNINAIPLFRDLKLQMLAGTPVAVGVKWRWQLLGPEALEELTPVKSMFKNGKDVYWCGKERVWKYSNGVVLSVGSTIIKGETVAVFANQLWVGDSKNGRIRVSDDNRPDHFYISDINSADEFYIESTASDSWTKQPSRIVSLVPDRDVIVVYTATDARFGREMPAPIHVKLEPAHTIYGVQSANVVPTLLGHVYLSHRDVVINAYGQIQAIGAGIRDVLLDDLNDHSYKPLIFTNSNLKEFGFVLPGHTTGYRANVVGSYSRHMYAHMFDYEQGLWYTRRLPICSPNSYPVQAFSIDDRGAARLMMVYDNGNVYIDGWSAGYGFFQENMSSNVVADTIENDQLIVGQPVFETAFQMYGTKYYTKELDTFHLDAVSYKRGYILLENEIDKIDLEASLEDEILLENADIPVSEYDVWVCAKNYLALPSVYTYVGRWTAALPNAALMFPRISGRLFSWRVKPVGNDLNKAVVWGYSTFVYNFTSDVS